MKAVGGIVAAFLAGVLGMVLLVPLMVMSSSAEGSTDCTAPTSDLLGDGGATVGGNLPPAVGVWKGEQLRNAVAIINAGGSLKIPQRGQVIAVMTAMKESSLKVLDNGDAVGPDSRGLFQQRDNGAWGSYSDRMDPTISSSMFYRALLQVEGWQTLPPTIAAHRVQRNADPNTYAEMWDDAVKVYAALSGVDLAAIGGAGGSVSVMCDGASGVVSDGTRAFPLPKDSGYVNRDNYGAAGGMWASTHTGIDLSVACGTPVFAATAGTVRTQTGNGGSWGGPNWVEVSQGPGRFTTWYAHMQSRTVKEGQQVAAGQLIGHVGTLGNSSGCHLHFEIHPKGGRYNQDQVDPGPWLAEVLAGGPTGGGTALSVGAGVRVASFNALGSHHTDPGGKNAHLDAGPVRMTRALAKIRAYGISIVGLQEFENPQAQALVAGGWNLIRATPNNRFRGGNTMGNAIAWDPAVWRAVGRDELHVPYGARTLHMPIVVLANSVGAQVTVMNVHNPAGRSEATWRARARAAEAAVVDRFPGPGIVTGDFNEAAPAVCAKSAVASAAGGTGCAPRAYGGVDFVFTTGGLASKGWTVDRSTRGSESDHPLVFAQLK